MSQPGLLSSILRSVAESTQYLMGRSSVSILSIPIKAANAAVIYADMYETHRQWNKLRFVDYNPPKSFVLSRPEQIKYQYPVCGSTINLVGAYANYAFDSTKLFLKMLVCIVELAIVLNDGPLWTKAYNFVTFGTRAYRFVKITNVSDININLLNSFDSCPPWLQNIFKTVGVSQDLLTTVNGQFSSREGCTTPVRKIPANLQSPSPRKPTGNPDGKPNVDDEDARNDIFGVLDFNGNINGQLPPLSTGRLRRHHKGIFND